MGNTSAKPIEKLEDIIPSPLLFHILSYMEDYEVFRLARISSNVHKIVHYFAIHHLWKDELILTRKNIPEIPFATIIKLIHGHIRKITIPRYSIIGEEFLSSWSPSLPFSALEELILVNANRRSLQLLAIPSLKRLTCINLTGYFYLTSSSHRVGKSRALDADLLCKSFPLLEELTCDYLIIKTEMLKLKKLSIVTIFTQEDFYDDDTYSDNWQSSRDGLKKMSDSLQPMIDTSLLVHLEIRDPIFTDDTLERALMRKWKIGDWFAMKLKDVADVIERLKSLRTLSVESIDFGESDLSTAIHTLWQRCPSLKHFSLCNSPDADTPLSEDKFEVLRAGATSLGITISEWKPFYTKPYTMNYMKRNAMIGNTEVYLEERQRRSSM